MDDSKLLRDYVENGSQAAFTELVTRSLGLVYAAALRQLQGDTHLAKDVAQEVFVNLAQKAGGLQNRASLAGWLYTSTHYAVTRALRTRHRQARRDQEAFIMNELTSPDSADDWNRVRPVLDEVMRELNETDREAILLRYFENCPYAEIGRKLRLNENSARMRTERALDKLHSLLGRRGVTSTSAALASLIAGQAVAAIPAPLIAEIAGMALASVPVGAGSSAAAIVISAASPKSLAYILTAVAVIGAVIIALQYRENRRIDFRTQYLSSQRDRAQTDAAPSTSPRTPSPQNVPRERLLGPAAISNRAWTLGTYARFLQRVPLPFEEKKKLQTLLAEKDLLEIREASKVSKGQYEGIDADDHEALTAIKAAASKEVVVEIRRLLGEKWYDAFRHYTETLKYRQPVERFAAQVRFTAYPLSADQVDNIADLLVQQRVFSLAPLPESLASDIARLLAPEQAAAARDLADYLKAIRQIHIMNAEAVAAGRIAPPTIQSRLLHLSSEKVGR
jgi:RNA polymerase sigma factor (sigma-70 family)